MTKKLFAAAFAIAMSAQCLADDVPTLTISKSSGDSKIVLSELLSIKYTDTDMILHMTDGSVQNIALDDIIVMQLGQGPTAINSVFSDCNSNDSYTITDISGKLIAKGKVADSIVLPGKKGLYIISVGEKSKKVLVK